MISKKMYYSGEEFQLPRYSHFVCTWRIIHCRKRICYFLYVNRMMIICVTGYTRECNKTHYHHLPPSPPLSLSFPLPHFSPTCLNSFSFSQLYCSHLSSVHSSSFFHPLVVSIPLLLPLLPLPLLYVLCRISSIPFLIPPLLLHAIPSIYSTPPILPLAPTCLPFTSPFLPPRPR